MFFDFEIVVYFNLFYFVFLKYVKIYQELGDVCKKIENYVFLQEKIVDIIKDEFFFIKYFENVFQLIFKGRFYVEDMDMVEGCFRYIKKIFIQFEVRNIV